jgi:hypothetical protein
MLYSIKIVLQNGEPIHFNDVTWHLIESRTRIIEIHRVSLKSVREGIFVKVERVVSKVFLCLDSIAYMEVVSDATKKETE